MQPDARAHWTPLTDHCSRNCDEQHNPQFPRDPRPALSRPNMGRAAASPTLFLLHGWMDVSASFQFLVDCLAARLARDRAGLARLRPDRVGARRLLVSGLLRRSRCAARTSISPSAPVNLVGHSMGGNIAALTPACARSAWPGW